MKKLYAKTFPEATKQSIATCVAMLCKFVNEIQIGDYVVFPSKSNRMVNIGIVVGGYEYEPNETEYVQQRKVKWIKHLSRTNFTQGALSEIGSFMSVFKIKNYSDEFLEVINKKNNPKSNSEEDFTVAPTAEAIQDNTKDFILKELSKKLKGHDFEYFIADLLNTMGYRTTVSPQGGDRGIDIIAYKDELPPRIVVQVKSKDDDVNETTIQSLKGAMREGDYGLFVTLSNYTKITK